MFEISLYYFDLPLIISLQSLIVGCPKGLLPSENIDSFRSVAA